MSDVTKPSPEGTTQVEKAQVNMVLCFFTADDKFDHTGDVHINDDLIACSEGYRDVSKSKVHRAIIDYMEEMEDGRLHAHGKLYIASGQNVQGKNQFIDVWVEKESEAYPLGRAGWTLEAASIDMTRSFSNVGLIAWK